MPNPKLGAMNATDCFDDANECDSWMSPTLDSKQLRAFSTLARVGSFTLAAKELNLTQSAISHSIR